MKKSFHRGYRKGEWGDDYCPHGVSKMEESWIRNCTKCLIKQSEQTCDVCEMPGLNLWGDLCAFCIKKKRSSD